MYLYTHNKYTVHLCKQKLLFWMRLMAINCLTALHPSPLNHAVREEGRNYYTCHDINEGQRAMWRHRRTGHPLKAVLLWHQCIMQWKVRRRLTPPSLWLTNRFYELKALGKAWVMISSYHNTALWKPTILCQVDAAALIWVNRFRFFFSFF